MLYHENKNFSGDINFISSFAESSTSGNAAIETNNVANGIAGATIFVLDTVQSREVGSILLFTGSAKCK